MSENEQRKSRFPKTQKKIPKCTRTKEEMKEREDILYRELSVIDYCYILKEKGINENNASKYQKKFFEAEKRIKNKYNE